MPIYEYRCKDCQQVFENWQSDFAERAVPCPVCGGGSVRIMSNTSFVLKGSGWYVTDYAKQPSKSSANGDSAGEAKGASDVASSTSSNAATSSPAAGS